MARKPQFIRGDYRRLSPFRHASWRWDLAVDAFRTSRRLKSWEDPAIGEAVQFQQWMAIAGPDKGVPKAIAAIAAAHGIYHAGDVVTDELEARLLASERPEVIAAKSGVALDTASAYSRIFFDAGDAGATDYRLWVAAGRERWPQEGFREGQAWRYMALAGGPIILDLLIADFLGRPHPNPAQRHHWAQMGRYLTRCEIADWTSPEVVKALTDESERIFLPKGRRTPEQQEMRRRLDSLRLAAGIAPRRRNRPNPYCQPERWNAPKELSWKASLTRTPTTGSP